MDGRGTYYGEILINNRINDKEEIVKWIIKVEKKIKNNKKNDKRKKEEGEEKGMVNEKGER